MSLLARIAVFYVNILGAVWDNITDRETFNEWERFRAAYPDAVPSDDWPDERNPHAR